ncbi:MAG: hypothetical protein JXQ29_04735 [Planctomycetes bacterium]|nr:hypothetical protein [Planctomycetota bacterium]
MRLLLWMALALVAVNGAGSGAQPGDGFLLLTLLDNQSFNAGAIVYLDPHNPAAVSTLATNVTPGAFHNFVRMAPGNVDMVAAEASLTGASLLRFDPAGGAATIAATLVGATNGFELDGDDTWILANEPTSLVGVRHGDGRLSSFLLSAPGTFNEVAILREGGVHYAVGVYTQSTVAAPKILGADRSGTITTLLATATVLNRLSGIEVDPRTGDLLTTDFDGPSSVPPEPGGGVEFNRVHPGGAVTPLCAFAAANALKVAQDNTAWVAGFVTSPTVENAVLHYDLAHGAVITILALPAIPSSRWSISSLELYGSQALTARGQGGPGAVIAIDLKSHRKNAAGAFYRVALSFGRRPGLQLANGEWLHLHLSNDLFVVTVLNRVPGICQGFAGVLDAGGAAQASVHLPASFPRHLGLTVFAAAVFLSATEVVQVTNTHWFEL